MSEIQATDADTVDDEMFPKIGKDPNRPDYQVVDEVFVANTEYGLLKMPLRFKTRVLRKVRTMDDMGGFFYLLDTITPHQSGMVDELDTIDLMKIVNQYFQEFQILAQASLPESSGS